MHLAVSDRVIFEENEFICTETGVVPHGNSISGYDWHLNPSSRWWSVSRNRLSRPPYKHGAEQNWIQRVRPVLCFKARQCHVL